jgi:hypothetical protein
MFLLVAYFPVLLPQFYIKNDLLTQNLPTRFVFAESLYSGFEPFWNPYINFGIPQYGDMNNGFWNPLQWLIGSTIGYSIYSITFEELFYILIGGWGIYKLSREFFTKETAIITGLVYMCSGYVLGHLQYLCWITGVGFFPYVLLYYIRALKKPEVRNFILGGFAVFIFLASTHPGLVIGALYFLVFLILVIFINRNDFCKQYYTDRFWLISGIFLLISCLFSVVVIFSNIDVLPYISRGVKVSMQETLMHPTTLPSYISLLFPLPVHRSGIFHTDIGMRNIYAGLLHFTGFILAFRFLKRKQLLSFLLPLLFFLLLAGGGYFKIFAWKYLPLLGYVRLNGEFTYFVLLLYLMMGATGFDHYFKNRDPGIYLKKIFTVLFWFSLLIGLITLVFLLVDWNSNSVFQVKFSGSIKDILKHLVDTIDFKLLVLVQVIINALTIYLAKRSIAHKRALLLVFIVNMACITWLTLPFTGLGKTSKKEIQAVINEFPKGITKQELTSIRDTRYIQPKDELQFMLISSYSKKIGNTRPDQYPVQLRTQEALLNDSATYSFIKEQAYLFLSGDTIGNTETSFDPDHIQVEKAGPGHITCQIHNEKYKWLTLLQNDYPYWTVKVDGIKTEHYTGFRSFISIPVEAGTHRVEFIFDAARIKNYLLANLLVMLISLIILIKSKWRKARLIK